MSEISYEQGGLLKDINGVKHGFFSKNGGVSSGVYSSLNCSLGSNDKPENVVENRRRVMTALGMKDAKLFGLSQIHSKVVYHVDNSTELDFQKGDALVTNQSGVALSVLGADCTPVLFSSINGDIIGAAHAGWRGAVIGIVEEVVINMKKLGAKREDIRVSIGPTIHQASYEVQQDFITQLRDLSDFDVDQFLLEDGGSVYFDLPSYLLKQCARSEIQAENLDLNTYTLDDEYFSFRRNTHQQLDDYGRQISVIGLE